VVINKLT
jgi:hypothetical protein